MVKIINNTNMSYNGACFICGKIQDGSKKQPYRVYYKQDGEKRGTNYLACSLKCAQEIVKKLDAEF